MTGKSSQRVPNNVRDAHCQHCEQEVAAGRGQARTNRPNQSTMTTEQPPGESHKSETQEAENDDPTTQDAVADTTDTPSEKNDTEDAFAETMREYNSVALQYAKMNRRASAEHIELLLAAMPHTAARRRIVDLGCGAGRDVAAFLEHGRVDCVGVDGSEKMLAVARERCPGGIFEEQDLCALDLPERSFDGAYANASLQHVPTQSLPNALDGVFKCLKPGGVLLISTPLGKDAEGWSQARSREMRAWVAWRSRETLERFCGAAGFESVAVPTARVYEGSSFLATVWRRPDDDPLTIFRPRVKET